MNKEQINKTFFEDLHEIQMNQINASIIDDARKVILGLITHISSGHRDDTVEKDEAILGALKWLKNHGS